MPGDAATLVQAAAALPARATWSATGIGRTSLPVMLAAVAAGGHLRVGLEDTLSYARGRPASGNAELVERASQLARLAQRPPMNTADVCVFSASSCQNSADQRKTRARARESAMRIRALRAP